MQPGEAGSGQRVGCGSTATSQTISAHAKKKRGAQHGCSALFRTSDAQPSACLALLGVSSETYTPASIRACSPRQDEGWPNGQCPSPNTYTQPYNGRLLVVNPNTIPLAKRHLNEAVDALSPSPPLRPAPARSRSPQRGQLGMQLLEGSFDHSFSTPRNTFRAPCSSCQKDR